MDMKNCTFSDIFSSPRPIRGCIPERRWRTLNNQKTSRKVRVYWDFEHFFGTRLPEIEKKGLEMMIKRRCHANGRCPSSNPCTLNFNVLAFSIYDNLARLITAPMFCQPTHSFSIIRHRPAQPLPKPFAVVRLM